MSVRNITRVMFFSLSLCVYAAMAQSREYVEGEDYTILSTQQVAPNNKVVEFFSYNCGHCKTFEPTLESWLEAASAGIEFSRVPVSFGRSDWKKSAELYTYANLLGMDGSFNHKVFGRIHDENKVFKTDKDIQVFLQGLSVSKEKFDSVKKSFSAKSMLKRHEVLAREFKISSVPSLIVRDAYVVELGKVRGATELGEIVSYLLQK